MNRSLRRLLAAAAAFAAASAPARALLPGPKPAPADEWRAVVGEYDSARGVLFIIEAEKRLWLVDTARATAKRTLLWTAESKAPGGSAGAGALKLEYAANATGKRLPVRAGDVALRRRSVGPEEGSNQLRVTPVRSLDDLRREALAASPPAEAR